MCLKHLDRSILKSNQHEVDVTLDLDHFYQFLFKNIEFIKHNPEQSLKKQLLLIIFSFSDIITKPDFFRAGRARQYQCIQRYC